MTDTTALRQLFPQIDPASGCATFSHTLTPSVQTDVVDCIVSHLHVLPVVFVPGVMGSNLKGSFGDMAGKPVWRLDGEVDTLKRMGRKDAGWRQMYLHPSRTLVDPGGAVPDRIVGILRRPQDFRARGWGEVGSTSYQDFLIWLEEQLNGTAVVTTGQTGAHRKRIVQLLAALAQVQDGRHWGAQLPFKPLTPDECQAAPRWSFPVYAFGYNWLDDNGKSGEALARRIDEIIRANNLPHATCKQVVVLTHSMGGLVARACSRLPGLGECIAGIVHGVMPGVGAAVAYRRCKVGMADEVSGVAGWGTSEVIGANGPEVTAVFAQSPGPLELLPTAQYPEDRWLELCDSSGSKLPEQPNTADPYIGVYRVRGKWWGLVKEAWLAPKDGVPLTWAQYEASLNAAKQFHESIKDHYHPNTWGFYGSRVNSVARVRWTVEPTSAQRPPLTPRLAQVPALTHTQVPLYGANPEEIPGPAETVTDPDGFVQEQPAPGWRLRLSRPGESGDGTVPLPSARQPLNQSLPPDVRQRILQFFELPGVGHEPAYKSPQAQQLVVYAIAKIAAALPQPMTAGPRR